LRRYLLTIILLLALLTVGGLAVASLTGGPSLTRGGYVPTLSSDPQTAQLQATIFVGALVAIIALTIGLGVFLAVSFLRFTAILAANAPAVTASQRTATNKPSSNNQGLGIPLSNPRSLAIFWVVLLLLVVGLQVLRYWGDPKPFGYLPGLSDLPNMQVLKLPGDHINGLPPFLAGPGDPVTAAQLLVLVLVVSVGAVVGAGFGLARGFDRLDHTVKIADKLPPTLPDKLIPLVKQRIESLRQPRPKRRPGNPLDAFLIGLNVVLGLVIVGIVAFYVVPSYSGVAAVDQAVKATQLAALASPTPQITSTPGGPSPADQLAQELAALPKGDAGRGQSLTVSNGCTACHISAPVGPGWMASADNATPKGEGVGTRAQHRFSDPGYTGVATSAGGYLLESVIAPNAHVVTGFQPNIMPQDFGKRLQPQDLADIIAYLQTLK
jgi:mono/diheme cytochrome c family protein